MYVSNLETSWAPVNKLNGSFSLDGCNGRIDILWNNVTTIQQTTRHVLAVTWITFDHLIGWFKTGVGDFCNGDLLMIGLLS